MIQKIQEPWDPKTVIELNLISDGEAKRMLAEYRNFHGISPLSETDSVNTSCWTPITYMFGGYCFAGTGTANINIPPKPKPTRGEEIVESAITARNEHVVLRYPTINDAGAANYLLPRYMSEDAAQQSAKHIRKCIADLIDKAIAEEREACAKLVEACKNLTDMHSEVFAAAIRQRGVA